MTERYEIPSLSPTTSAVRWKEACERFLRDAGVRQSELAERMAKELGKTKDNLKSAVSRFMNGNPDKLRPWFNPRSGHSPELECFCDLLGIKPRQLHQELLRAAGSLPDVEEVTWHLAFPELEPAEAFVAPPIELGRVQKTIDEIVDQVVEKPTPHLQHGGELRKAVVVTLTGADGSGCRSLARRLADKVASRLHHEAGRQEGAEHQSGQHKDQADPRVVAREPRRGLLLFDSGDGPVRVEITILRPHASGREQSGSDPRKDGIELSLRPWRISEVRALARNLGQVKKLDANRRKRLEAFADAVLDELQDSEYLPGDAIWMVSVVADWEGDTPPTAGDLHRREARRSWDAVLSRDRSGFLAELPDGFPARFWEVMARVPADHVVLELRRGQVEEAIREALEGLARGSASTPALRSALDALGDTKRRGREQLADTILRGVLAGEARAVLDALLAAGHLEEKDGFVVPTAPRAARTFAALGLDQSRTVPWAEDAWEGLLVPGALDLVRELAICGFDTRRFCDALADGPQWGEIERAIALVAFAASASDPLPPDLAETVLIPAWRTALIHWHFARTLAANLLLGWFDWVTGSIDLEHPPPALLTVSERYREVLPPIPDGHTPPWDAPRLWQQRFAVSESVERDRIKPEWAPVLAWRKTILAAAPWQALDTILGLRLGEIDLPEEALEALRGMPREREATNALMGAAARGDARALQALAWPARGYDYYFRPGPGVGIVACFRAEPPSHRAALTRFFEFMGWMDGSLHQTVDCLHRSGWMGGSPYESGESLRRSVCVRVLAMLAEAQQRALLRTSLQLPRNVADWLALAGISAEEASADNDPTSYVSLPYKAPSILFAIELAEAVGNTAFLEEVVDLPQRIAATCKAGMVGGHLVLLRPRDLDLDLRKEELTEKVGEVQHVFDLAHRAAMALLRLGCTGAAEKWLEPEALAKTQQHLLTGLRSAGAPLAAANSAVSAPEKLEELPCELIAELAYYVESQRRERSEDRLEVHPAELVPLFHDEGTRGSRWLSVASDSHEHVPLEMEHPGEARWLVSMLVPQRLMARDRRGQGLWMTKGDAEKTRTETRDAVLEALFYAIDSRGHALPPLFAEWLESAQARQQHDTGDGSRHTSLESQVEATLSAYLASGDPALIDRVLRQWLPLYLRGKVDGDEEGEFPSSVRKALYRALRDDDDVLDRAWDLAQEDAAQKGALAHYATRLAEREGIDTWREPDRREARRPWAAEAIACLPVEERRRILAISPGVPGVLRLLKERYREEAEGRNRVLWAALLTEAGSGGEWKDVVRRWTAEESPFTGCAGLEDADAAGQRLRTIGDGPPVRMSGGDRYLLEGLADLATRSPDRWLPAVKRLWKLVLTSSPEPMVWRGGCALISCPTDLEPDPLKVLLDLLEEAGQARWALKTAGFPLNLGEPVREEGRSGRYLGYHLYDLWVKEADWRAIQHASRDAWRLYSHGWFKLVRGTPPRELLDDCQQTLARLLESQVTPGDEDFEWFMATEPLTLHRTADLVRLLKDHCPEVHPARRWFVRHLNSYADLNGPLRALYRLEREWAVES